MSHAIHQLIGEVGDVRARCESLLDILRRVDHLVDGTEEVSVEHERQLFDASYRWANNAKHHIDWAFDSVGDWYKEVKEIVDRYRDEQKK
jgi:hypothetical protein